MAKGTRGGKRKGSNSNGIRPSNAPFDNCIVYDGDFTQIKGYNTGELKYFIDSDGNKRYDGEDGWKLKFDTHTEVEIEDAEWLQEIIGEKVYLNPKAELPKRQKSADYVTERGMRIEQKGPTKPGKDKIERLINQGKHQANIILVNVSGLELLQR